MQQRVNATPAPMPIAPAQPPVARRVGRGQQRRADAMQELREGLKLEARLAGQSIMIPPDEAQKALARNEMRHFIAAICTGGLWAPVWLFVLMRNTRRHGRTAQGRLTATHMKTERNRLRTEQKARRQANPRGFAEVPPRPAPDRHEAPGEVDNQPAAALETLPCLVINKRAPSRSMTTSSPWTTASSTSTPA